MKTILSAAHAATAHPVKAFGGVCIALALLSAPASAGEYRLGVMDKLRIRVADHGPGLDADELDKLGEPYFRGAAALGKKGSGLGYHFTRRIVEAHAGTLTARSGMDVGLEVEVFLPR